MAGALRCASRWSSPRSPDGPATPRSRPLLAIVSDAIYPYHKGGKEVRYHHLAPRLAREAFEVHVYTMHWWSGPVRRVDGDVTFHAICRRRPLYRGSRRSIVQAVVFAAACLRLMGRRFDVIEADQMPYLPLFTLRLVAWAKRVPLVVTWHELWGLAYWKEYLGRAGVVGAAIESLARRVPDVVVAENVETRRRLVRAGLAPERVRLIPCGVDLSLVRSAEPAGTAFDVVFAGRLLAHKRVDVLVEALGHLREAGTPLTCAVVGDGPERSRLEELARRLRVDEQVRFFGTLDDHAAVYGLMKSARLFVLPSVREGFGLVVVEALACGIPVITTDHPDNQARLLLQDDVTGWLCAPLAVPFAAAIRRALEHGPLDLTRADEALRPYDWDCISAEVAGAYLTGLERARA